MQPPICITKRRPARDSSHRMAHKPRTVPKGRQNFARFPPAVCTATHQRPLGQQEALALVLISGFQTRERRPPFLRRRSDRSTQTLHSTGLGNAPPRIPESRPDPAFSRLPPPPATLPPLAVLPAISATPGPRDRPRAAAARGRASRPRGQNPVSASHVCT